MAEAASSTADEIEQLLGAHSGEPVDYVAIVTLLNTVAGGHYEERHTEEAIRAALRHLLQSGRISIEAEPEVAAPGFHDAADGHSDCKFRLAR